MGMSQAYVYAMTSNLPHVTIVFGHFQLIKLMNEKHAELRHALYWQTIAILRQHIPGGTRQLLLKNPEKLRDDCNERVPLEASLTLHNRLAAACCMKGGLRLPWSLPCKAAAYKSSQKCWRIAYSLWRDFTDCSSVSPPQAGYQEPTLSPESGGDHLHSEALHRVSGL